MSVSVNHNIPSLTAQRFLGTNNRAAEKSMARLSSGLRVNSAADDAAGLAISEKMRGQIRGLDMANKNAQDTSSLIQVAEGALDQTHSILGRMRELAVQAANDTNTDDDRNEIDNEIKQLKKEIDRIGNTTEFNTRKLLDGAMRGAKDKVEGRMIINNNSQVTLNPVSVQTALEAIQQIGLYDGNITVIRNSVESGVPAFKVVFDNAVNAGGSALTLIGYGNAGAPITGGVGSNGYGITPEAGVDPTTGMITVGGLYYGPNRIDECLSVTVNDNTLAIGGVFGCQTIGIGTDNTPITFTLADPANSPGGQFKFTDMAVGESISFNFARAEKSQGTLDQSLMTQLGANTGQVTFASVGDMRSKALGLRYTYVGSREAAIAAIAEVDNAAVRVSAQRSLLGALQNRMEYAAGAIETTSENVSAAESRIRDTDMAKEMSGYTRENVKSQAAQSMLAQANAKAQNVLSLLQ